MKWKLKGIKMDIKNQNSSKTLIGYSAFSILDDGYEYNENACYIADNQESLKEFLGTLYSDENYRIEHITISDILSDYGCSSGEFAMEPETLKRFEIEVKELDVTYNAKPYEDIFINKEKPDLFIVNIEKKKIIQQLTVKQESIEILNALKTYDGIYKKKQVDAAIELKEEITPSLIEILENVLSNNQTEYMEDNDYFGHIYAIFLLAHFKENKAHKIIIDLCSLPSENWLCIAKIKSS